MKVPDNFHLLLSQGGATQEFSSVPLNLAGHVYGEPDACANVLITGKWSEAGAKEISKFHSINQVNIPSNSSP